MTDPALCPGEWFRIAPRLPYPWTRKRIDDAGAQYSDGEIGVIASVARYPDGHRWLHVSLSRRDRIPSYADLKRIKELFVGDRKAIQVFPPAAEFVNINPNVLHLWSCLDGDPLPDFRWNGVI